MEFEEKAFAVPSPFRGEADAIAFCFVKTSLDIKILHQKPYQY